MTDAVATRDAAQRWASVWKTAMLRFDADGLVIEQRDAWNQADGLRSPPDGWGA
jgi:hypothetical protein